MKRFAALVWLAFAICGFSATASPAQTGRDEKIQSSPTREVRFVAVSSTSPEDRALAEQVMKADEDFRKAKLASDLAGLDRVLSADYIGTNQTGNTRDKKQLLELFEWFRIESLETNEATVRFSGDNAVVTGVQTERSGTGNDRMLFTRVYVKAGAGKWLLLSSTQFRDPHGPVNAAR